MGKVEKAKNLPQSASSVVMYKLYDQDSLERHQVESYTVIRMPGSYLMTDSICLKPLAAKETLVSGKNNRGLSGRIATSWWAVSNVSRSNIPFARNLDLRK